MRDEVGGEPGNADLFEDYGLDSASVSARSPLLDEDLRAKVLGEMCTHALISSQIGLVKVTSHTVSLTRISLTLLVGYFLSLDAARGCSALCRGRALEMHQPALVQDSTAGKPIPAVQ